MQTLTTMLYFSFISHMQATVFFNVLKTLKQLWIAETLCFRVVLFALASLVELGNKCIEWCVVACTDLDSYSTMQTVVIYPLTTADIYSDVIRQQTESASSVELTLEDTIPGKPPKGSVLTSKSNDSTYRCALMMSVPVNMSSWTSWSCFMTLTSSSIVYYQWKCGGTTKSPHCYGKSCHMGSHSVTCHLAAVTFPPSP